ncbi:MAG: hybrid sensor histidine kinase/response regulator [Gammaproteobacteria bacterium]|nr:hybrid sensor histidine kinase/response regulator [Gammaproteobacteria bacterium]
MGLFRAEAEQQLSVLSEGLLALDQNPSSAKHLEMLMRAAHSIKGAARLVGVDAVVKLAHCMEDHFVAAQQGKIVNGPEHTDVLLKGVDMISRIAALDEAADAWIEQHRAEYDAVLVALTEMPNSPVAPERAIPASGTSDKSVSENPPKPVAIDPSMLALFRTEVEQQAAILTEGLLGLEQDPASAKHLESLMRAAHSIKGAARLVGLQAVVQVAHRMEDGFVAAQQGKIALKAEYVDVLLKGVDMITSIAALDGNTDAGVEPPPPAYDALLFGLDALLQGGEVAKVQVTAPSVAQTPAAPVPVPASTKEAEIAKDRVLRVSADQLNRLMGLAGEAMVEARWLRPHAESMLRLKRRQVEMVKILDDLREALESGRRRDQMLEQVRAAQRKIADSREFLAQRMAELESFDNRLNNLSWRLRREVISSRMRPFADGVHGFSRMVRDVARSLGKEVQLDIGGQETLVDRDILDKIEAPLNHLLRNAVDHGIESPDARVKAGKPAKGTLRLFAYHQAGMLSIVLEDDGQGVSLERLRKKVCERGLVSPEMAASLSEQELLEFLFLPGFSTRDSVSEISGRGVGLDVVHDTVQKMRGTVRITSQPGKGTRFHMQLPLTLSVIPALLVEIANEPYALPLARIDRILRVETASIESIEGCQFVGFDNHRIGLVSAAQVLGMQGVPEAGDAFSVVVLGDRDERYGLAVERFLGERDLVVHVLPPRLGKVTNIAAAALMEDGSPVLILDVDDMVHSIRKIAAEGQLSRIAGDNDAVQSDGRSKRILVVDDSITVREVERTLLESIGYQVDVAVDGMDGWNAAREGHYDLVISDIDMPRMDGIELVRMLKQDPHLQRTPVVIVSYKDREEDRRRGLNAGADYYLTKGSFHDDTLRQAVHDLIGESV